MPSEYNLRNGTMKHKNRQWPLAKLLPLAVSFGEVEELDEEVTADVDDVDVAEIAAGAVVAVEVASPSLRASALGLLPPEEEFVVEIKASVGKGDGGEGEISLFPRVPLTDEGFETERLEGSVGVEGRKNG